MALILINEFPIKQRRLYQVDGFYQAWFPYY